MSRHAKKQKCRELGNTKGNINTRLNTKGRTNCYRLFAIPIAESKNPKILLFPFWP